MKKLFLTFLFFVFAFTQAQIVNIPDPVFKARLLAASQSNGIASTETPVINETNGTWQVSTNHIIDTNNDGQIQVSEASLIRYLQLPYFGINNLTGIESFTNLQYLRCGSNELTTLDVSGLTNLKLLYVGDNQLTTLNVSGLTNLQTLYCNSNQFTSLNVSGLTNLKFLNCGFNQLPTLDVSGLTNLQTLYCFNNQFTTLNVSGLTNLKHLNCDYNQLTTLNVSGLTNLETLWFKNNQLTTLNVSGLTYLSALNCSYNQLTTLNVNGLTNFISLECSYNQLTSLFIKNNNTSWYALHINNNPNLSYICADEEDLTIVQSRINAAGTTIAPNCHVNSYCSFTPGGIFYTIQGNQKFDANNNGCDASYPIFPNVKYAITNGTTSGTFISNTTGNYSIPVGAGTHTLTPQFENPNYFTVTPANAVVTFPATASPFTQNFCIAPNGSQLDVEVVFAPAGPARPGFDADYLIVYKNMGNQIANGEVSLTYMNDRLDFISSSITPSNQTSEQLMWSYQNLLPLETRTIQARFNVNSPMETPPVNNGDLLSYGVSITPLSGDVNAFNNNFALRQEVVGSYDPNDKTCVQGSVINPDQIGKYVHYVIRFENTGTFAAENVVVKDMIDATKFDVSTLQLIRMSHQGITRITGNKVEFIFEGINLPFDDANNDGYIIFKIKTKSTLTAGSIITNKADIYFDYNYPIITNLETSVFQVLSNPNYAQDETVAIFPNPAKNNLNIKSNNNIKSVELYDFQGRLLMSQIVNSLTSIIDISSHANGVYFVKTTTDLGVGLEKVIKE